jgi:PPOX class probable F420-dependent enzyme
VTEAHPSVAEYLKSHRTGVLATQRKNGPPQQVLINYNYDGHDIVMSTRGPSVKVQNALRRPGVSLAVVDDSGNQVVVSGRADVITGFDNVLRVYRQRLSAGNTRGESDEQLQERLKREDRVILRITPERYFPATFTPRG